MYVSVIPLFTLLYTKMFPNIDSALHWTSFVSATLLVVIAVKDNRIA